MIKRLLKSIAAVIIAFIIICISPFYLTGTLFYCFGTYIFTGKDVVEKVLSYLFESPNWIAEKFEQW